MREYIYVRGRFVVVCLKKKFKKQVIPWRDKGQQVYYMKDPINWELLEEDCPLP